MTLLERRRGFPTYRNPSGAAPARPDAKQAVSRGFRISYDDVGEGTAIVFISGMTESGGEWWEPGYVERLVALGHRVIVVERVNDPVAFGAAAAGRRLRPYTIDLARIAAPALVYVGGEDQPELSRRTADALGVELIELPGRDHRTALMATEAAMAFVAPFLAATA
jgi:pimeloyl-ACP methyl ester carboxylesterase